MKLDNEDLKDIGIKLVHRKMILEETKKLLSPSSAESKFSKQEDTETLHSNLHAFKEITGKDIRNADNARASCEALKQKIADKEKPER